MGGERALALLALHLIAPHILELKHGVCKGRA